ncbi:PqqD family protein [Jiangella asiatica]|uniref:PqqD family protein n=1 Tax=Jiangella asiatica TaxID=2530372 RepID=A0A4R5D803_9ACTN|nr:PqqD family protein [Jiangella asiatica]TDE07474.1 PqqD family protein [Jiangella asiatica]
MKLRSDGVSWREIDGETVILDLSSSTYLKTNQAGSTLMRLLAEDRSSDELAEGLVDAFGIPADRARADTEAFIRMLRERKLLEGSD